MFTDWKGIKQNTCSWSRLIILEANDRAFTTLGGSNSGTASDSAGGRQEASDSDWRGHIDYTWDLGLFRKVAKIFPSKAT